MTVIQCDLCRKELEPSGVVVAATSNGRDRPARLHHDGKDVRDVCPRCADKCHARVWVDAGGKLS